MQSAASMPAGAEDPAGRRACDQCRLRKIRCDKETPCSNCRVAKRSCSSTGAGQRTKEARARVLISSQYERKIDQIDARLANIETLLQNLTSSSKPLAPVTLPHHIATPQTTSASSVPAASSISDGDSSDEEADYRGDSGLTAHTTFASEFLTRAVRSIDAPSLCETGTKIQSALANLGQLVEMQKRRSISHGPRFPLQRPIPPGGLSKLPLPPLDVVSSLLQKSKSEGPSIFNFTCAIAGIADFTALCRQVYFPSDDYSDATLCIVNAGLYSLFMEQQSLVEDPALKAEYGSHLDLSKSNLETCLANLPLFLSPKIENVMALHMGAIYSIDVARPSVAWQLVSTAAQLCQTGGFHRMSSMRHDPPPVAQLKMLVFWNVYLLDKGLSLRLGRSSVINECDIDISREVNYQGFEYIERSSFPTYWVQLCSLQSQIYEFLYSPAALAGSQSKLVEKAQSLAAACRELEREATEGREEELRELRALKSSEFVEVFFAGDQVQFYVTMTLVYQVIPAPEGSTSRFCDECLDSARMAMRTHLCCVNLLDASDHLKSMYVHWNLMLTPFAPFFIVFCYVIETSSPQDMALLQQFVASLQKARDASSVIEKLYRLCQLMCDVAVLYVDAKSQEQDNKNNSNNNRAPIGDEFDLYLSQLGFMPGEDQTMMNAGDGTGQVQGHGPVAQIADWWSGNRNMIGLLEEDLSQIDPSSWMQQGPV